MSSSDPAPHWLHFVGAGGSGMSALIQFHALVGGRASGSDRAFDQGLAQQLADHLEAPCFSLNELKAETLYNAVVDEMSKPAKK